MKFDVSRSLAAVHPELAAQWSDKNGDLKPDEVTYAAKLYVWWRCSKGHEWQARIRDRHYGNNCPYCANKKVLPGYNDLATTHPQLAEEWSEENSPLTPQQVTAGSHLKVIWVCKKCHQTWKAQLSDRKAGNGCPYCANRKVMPGVNDLATLNPLLASEWSDRNLPVKPDDVMPFSWRLFWWKCEKGHEWQAKVRDRSVGNGCPYCSRKWLKAGVNDLATEYPELAAEWSERNENSYPFEFSPYSRKAVWWKCKTCGFEWSAIINHRREKPECPNCRKQKNQELIRQKREEERERYYLEKNLPDLLIRHYCQEKSVKYLKNSHAVTGLALQYYFPDQKAVLEFSNQWNRKEAGWNRQYLKNDMLKKAGYTVVRILARGDKVYDNCICITRRGDTAEELAAVLKSAFIIMKVED